MVTFDRASLPQSINYNGETLTHRSAVSARMGIRNLRPETVISEFKKQGKTAVLVRVLSSNLKGKTDLHGKPYSPSEHIFSN